MAKLITESVAHILIRVEYLFILTVALSVALLVAPTYANAAQDDPAVQTTATKPPKYDVVSIKLNKSSTTEFHVDIKDDHFIAINLPFEQLMQRAYHTREDLISGISGPVRSAHFDIVAKVLPVSADVPVKLSKQQLDAMLLPLLQERFQLRAHTESKERSTYELVVHKGGAKMNLSSRDIGDSRILFNFREGGEISGYQIAATRTSVASFASFLSSRLHRTVVDKTGLAGNYDFTLNWSFDVTTARGNNLSISNAIEEQLGLQLQSSTGPVETLVVDHAEMPSAN